MLEENHKNILVRRIYHNAHKIIKNQLKKIKIYKIKKFNSVFSTNKGLIDKGKFNVRRKIQNWMFKDSIGFSQGLIAFIENLIVRKIDF